MKVFRKGQEILEIKDFRQIGRFMEVAQIECTVKSPTPIAFEIGDYVIYDYNGLNYSLYDVPTPKKQARSGSYGEAFIYDLKFKADTEQLDICPFLDLVANDNGLHYTSLPSFSTFENVYGIVARLQANMDYLYPNQWRFDVVDTTDSELSETLSEAKEFSISGKSCLDGLKKIYDTWGVSYIHTYENGFNVITLGKSAGTTSLFRYGKGQGLRTIKRNVQNADQLCTRVYAFGSTRNIPARWYNEKGYIGEAQYAPNLMIPPSKWVDGIPQGAYIDAIFNGENRVEKYGLRIKTFSYDGSDSNKDEIFPSVEKVTAKNIRNAKAELGETTNIPSARYADSERMDEVLVGSNITDDGTSTESGYELYSDKLTSEVAAREEVYEIATLRSEEKYDLQNIQKFINLCSFNITKPAGYRVEEILDFITFRKNDRYSTVSANLYLKRPSGDYIKLEGSSIVFTEELTGSLKLSEKIVDFKEKGNYTLVAEIVVTWSTDYVVPEYDGPIDLKCTIDNALVTIARGNKILPTNFTIELKQIGFNLNNVTASDGSFKTISFKSGMCSGRTFNIVGCKYSEANDSWVLDCRRIIDSSVSQSFPNSIFPIVQGDQFVLLNINMPDLYVHTAMQRLYDAAYSDLKHFSLPQYQIEPEIDNIQMLRSPQTLKEGMYMPIEDEDLGLNEEILIDSVTITDKEKEHRKFEVVLRNDKIFNKLNKLASRISDLESANSQSAKAAAATPVQEESQSVVLNDATAQPSLFEKVNIGTEEEPIWAVMPKDINGSKVGIISETFITSGGKNPSSGGSGAATTLGGLINVDQVVDDTFAEDLVLVKNANRQNWTYRALSTLGLNETQLADYLTKNSYLNKNTADGLYASLASFNDLNTKVNNFLEGSDTDTIINKWKELEAFLAGQTESSTLAELLGIKLDKSVYDTFVSSNFTDGAANNALKLGGQLPEYYAAKSALDTHISNYNNFVDVIYAEHVTAFNDYKKTTNERLDALESLWSIDEENNALYPQNNRGIYSYSFITSGGKANSGSSGGGLIQAVYDYNNLGGNFNNNNLTDTFNAYAINSIYNEVQQLKNNPSFSESAMWTALGTNATDKVIAASHIPDLSSKYLTLSGGTLTSSNVVVLGLDTTHNTQNAFLLLHKGVMKTQLGYVVGVGSYMYDYSVGIHLGIDINGAAYCGKSSDVSSNNHHILIHSGNYATTTDARYLQLSGGTIESTSYYPLILDTTQTINNGIIYNSNKVNKAQIGWSSNVGTFLLNYNSNCYMGVKENGTPYYMSSSDWVYHTLIHSGNYSSYALPLSGGTMANNAGISWSYNVHSWDAPVDGLECISTLNDTLGYYAGFSYKGFYGLQMRAYGGNTDLVQVRGFNHANWGTWRNIIHSGNIGDYALPLSGGKINGLVTFANQEIALGSLMLAYTTAALRVRTPSGDSWFGMMNDTSCHIYTDAPQFYMNKPLKVDNGYDVIHSGNIMSQSVNRLISPYSYEGGTSINNNTTPESLFSSSYTFSAMMENCTAFSGYATVLNFTGYKQYGGVQLAVHYNNTTPRMALRNFTQTYMKFTNWREIAFTDSNVASAQNLTHSNGTVGATVTSNGNVLIDTLNAGVTNVSSLTSSGNITSTSGYIKGNHGLIKAAYIGTMASDRTTAPDDYAATIESLAVRYWDAWSGWVWSDVHCGTLEAAENIFAEGEITAGRVGSSSDRKLKNNIEHLTADDAISIIKKLNPSLWTWNSLSHAEGKKGYGLIAQDVQPILPDAVIQGKNHLSLDYNQFHAFEIAVLQSHETRLEEVERENREMRCEIERLNKELNQYRRA